MSHIHADVSVGIASNINAGLDLPTHAFQVQHACTATVIHYILHGTPSLQLHASRVTINSNGNSAARDLFVYYMQGL